MASLCSIPDIQRIYVHCITYLVSLCTLTLLSLALCFVGGLGGGLFAAQRPKQKIGATICSSVLPTHVPPLPPAPWQPWGNKDLSSSYAQGLRGQFRGNVSMQNIKVPELFLKLQTVSRRAGRHKFYYSKDMSLKCSLKQRAYLRR